MTIPYARQLLHVHRSVISSNHHPETSVLRTAGLLSLQEEVLGGKTTSSIHKLDHILHRLGSFVLDSFLFISQSFNHLFNHSFIIQSMSFNHHPSINQCQSLGRESKSRTWGIPISFSTAKIFASLSLAGSSTGPLRGARAGWEAATGAVGSAVAAASASALAALAAFSFWRWLASFL